VLERLVDQVGELGPWAYLVIFVAVSLESAAFLGFLIPSETLVFLGGFLASQGVLSLADLMIVVAVGAIIGDSIGYELGRCLGRAWLVRIGRPLGFRDGHMERVDRFFARHGGKTVFFARFSAFFRIMVPFAAGAARLRYLHFLFYNVLGGVAWAVASVLVGYVAGESWLIVHRWIGRAGAVAALVILLAIAWLLRRRWMAREQ
jgi:membrane protein DedA with SNARE-associated domain